LGAHFAYASLNQWMALTPPELVQALFSFEFGLTGQDPPEKQLRLTIAGEISEF
jgi:hypothetical protein